MYVPSGPKWFHGKEYTCDSYIKTLLTLIFYIKILFTLSYMTLNFKIKHDFGGNLDLNKLASLLCILDVPPAPPLYIFFLIYFY